MGLCSTIRKEWWFSSRIGPELDGGEGPPHVQLHDELAVQPAEYTRANDSYKEDPGLLQVGVALQGSGQHLFWGDEGRRETAGRSSISVSERRGLRVYRGGGEGGAKVRTFLIWTSDMFTFEMAHRHVHESCL
jgi:hypothetical protein